MITQENSIQKPANWYARPAIETHPPKLMLKIQNFIMKHVVIRKLGDVIMLITFTGRKSGKTFTTPIGYTRAGNILTSCCDSPWQKNLEGGASVKVTIKGKQIEGLANTIRDKGQVIEYVKHHLQSGGSHSARQMGLSLPKGYFPTDDELGVMLRDRVLISIELQGSN